MERRIDPLRREPSEKRKIRRRQYGESVIYICIYIVINIRINTCDVCVLTKVTCFCTTCFIIFAVMDVMSFREGCLRAVPCTGVSILLWFLGGLFVLYEMILLNSQDVDTRDMLNDFRSTIGAIQDHHNALSVGFWPRLAPNISSSSFLSEVVLPSYDVPVVYLNTTNLTCPQLITTNTVCLSATLSAESLLRGQTSEYTSCHGFAAAYPNSTQVLTSAATTTTTTTSVLMNMQYAPSTLPSTWNATTWELVACNNWNTMLSLDCTNLIRDPCAEAWNIMSQLANNNNNNNNILNNNAPIRARFVQFLDRNSSSTGINLSLYTYIDMLPYSPFPTMLANGTAIQDSINRAGNISSIATLASIPSSSVANTIPPRVGLKDAIYVNQEKIQLLSPTSSSYQRHKGFGWKPPFWVHPDPCP